MISLVLAELNRLRSRRLTVITVLAVVLAAGLFQLAVNSAVSPPSTAELAAGQEQYQSDLREYEQNAEQNEQMRQECLDQGGDGQGCDFKPRLEWYVTPAEAFADIAPTALMFATMITGLGAFLMAASFIGAEYTSGSITNWLTFIPQRWKVFTAKAVAVLLGSGLLGTVILGGTLASAALLSTSHGGEITSGQALTASAARGVGLVVAMALISFGLALIARHTAAAIGVLLGYALLNIVLLLLFGVLPSLQRIRPFLPDLNLQAFLNKGGYSYTDSYPKVESGGTTVDQVQQTITVAEAGIYWLVLTAVTLGVAFIIFRRRDVV
jgi:ABC-2 type transport system permease protein